MPTRPPAREPRHGVIIVHPFGSFHEAQFLDDPVLIERLVADGHSWRFNEAVMLSTEP